MMFTPSVIIKYRGRNFSRAGSPNYFFIPKKTSTRYWSYIKCFFPGIHQSLEPVGDIVYRAVGRQTSQPCKNINILLGLDRLSGNR